MNTSSSGGEHDAVLETKKRKTHRNSAAVATKRAKKSQPKAKASLQTRAKSVRKQTDPVAELDEEAEPVDEVIQSTL
jgi:hypothetical protein